MSKDLQAELEQLKSRCSYLESVIESSNLGVYQDLSQLELVLKLARGIIYRCLNDDAWTMVSLVGDCEGIFGYCSEDILENNAVSFVDLIFVEDREAVRDAVQRAIDEFNPWEISYRIVTGNKEIRWITERGKAVYDSGGMVKYLEGAFIDITEARKIDAENAFRVEVLDQIRDFITVTDLNGQIKWVNKAVSDFMHLNRDDLGGRSVTGYNPDSDGQLRQSEIIESTLKNGFWRGEVVNENDAGEMVILDCRTNLVYGENGEPVAMSGISTDITETRRHQTALRISEEKYRAFFENSPVGIFRTTVEGRLLDANPALARMLGWENPQEFINNVNNIREDIYADPQIRDSVIDNSNTDNMVSYEVNLKKRNGTTIIANIITRIETDSEGKKAFLEGIVEDITEKMSLKKQKDQLEEEYRQAQKIESIGRLAGGIAHDLNNLLVPVLGFAEILLDEMTPGSPHHEAVKEIKNASLKSRDLLRQILAFGRKQILSEQKLDLNILIKNMENLIRRTVRENIEITFDLSSFPLVSSVDAVRFEQVLINLIVNAQDAIKQSGSIVIRSGDFTNPQGTQTGEFAFVSVNDSGSGIPSDVLPHIFEPFYTTKPKGSGTGLGLATVYGIIKQHRGDIQVNTSPGKGTSFTVYFPRETDTAPCAANSSELSTCPKGQGQHILVLEDDRNVIRFIENVLKRKNFTVTSMSSGVSALYYIENSEKPVNLIVSDVVMPGMSGPEFYEQLKKKYPQMPVIFISGYCESEMAMPINRGPLVEFLQKPFDIEVLCQMVLKLTTHPQ
ncbi:PAS domain S-box protein [Myxococcota bacterium]|nr:PAS domain S-box protein [Myxococcota bacterium]MBU1380288.1 PAS domain S-box protein [Myxococcota bacterium]MBU1498633.1 PAS domain S-box protein [Myxococcota bacterium]